MMGHRPKDKVGAPPVQGLLEHITSPASAAPSPYTATPERRQVSTTTYLKSIKLTANISCDN